MKVRGYEARQRREEVDEIKQRLLRFLQKEPAAEMKPEQAKKTLKKKTAEKVKAFEKSSAPPSFLIADTKGYKQAKKRKLLRYAGELIG